MITNKAVKSGTSMTPAENLHIFLQQKNVVNVSASRLASCAWKTWPAVLKLLSFILLVDAIRRILCTTEDSYSRKCFWGEPRTNKIISDLFYAIVVRKIFQLLVILIRLCDVLPILEIRPSPQLPTIPMRFPSLIGEAAVHSNVGSSISRLSTVTSRNPSS